MTQKEKNLNQSACLQEIVNVHNAGCYTLEQIMAHYQTLDRNRRTMNSDFSAFPRDPIYYVTASIVHSVDLLVKQRYRNVVIDSLEFCLKSENFFIHAYCIMPNRVYMMVSGISKPFIASILSEFKLISTFELLKRIEQENDERRNWMLWLFRLAARARHSNNTYHIWEDANELIELVDLTQVNQRMDEIHRMPVKNGYVEEPGAWTYSSAPNYQMRTGKLPVTMIPS